MRSVGLALLAISVVLGGLAVWGFRHVSGARAAPASASVAETRLVVASAPIAAGEKLTPLNLRLQAWPQGATPPGALRTVADAVSGEPIALTPIAPNEPILKSRISGRGARRTLSGVIQPGMRAASIRVDDVMGVAGFVLPGDFVDVLLIRADGADDQRSDILFEGVRVLAVDQLASQNKADPVVAKAATVELTPSQSQKLALARQVGTVALALRGTADPVSPSATRPVRLSDLGPAARPATSRAAPPRARQTQRPAGPAIEVYRGGQPTLVALRTE